MKKFMVVLGIAFALIVSVVMFGFTNKVNAETVEAVEPVTIEEAVTDWAIRNNPNHEIGDVEVFNVEQDEHYGGRKVNFHYEKDGGYWFASVSTDALDDFTF